jgi:hypothetical protein
MPSSLAVRPTSRPISCRTGPSCSPASPPNQSLRLGAAPPRPAKMPAPSSTSKSKSKPLVAARATSTPTILDRIKQFLNPSPEAAVSAPPAVVRPPPVSPETVPSWSELESAAVAAADLGGYSLNPGGVPSSFRAKVINISPTDATEPPPPSAAPVLFFSDTNTWCPFAQRVAFYLKLRGDLEHEIALIDLR